MKIFGKRKNTIIGILVFALILSMASCGKKEEVEEKEPETTTEYEYSTPLEPIVATATDPNPFDYNYDEAVETASKADALELENPREDILIAIDPGHQGPNVDMSASEPNGPGSSTMKMKATGGTTGRFTGTPEYQLNLDISLMLRDSLEALGYRTIMTREDNDTAISNMERAQLANDAGANIAIRIHANGSENSADNGALAMTCSKQNPYVKDLYTESTFLANAILSRYCNSTGMKNCGIVETDTMTGINWSEIPVMILEMGYMTNENDDKNMQDPEFRKKMVEGIVAGIEYYYGISDTQKSDVEFFDNKAEELSKDIQDILDEENARQGAEGAVYAKNLSNGDTISLGADKLKAASLIKLLIAGAVLTNKNQLLSAGTKEDVIDGYLEKMITVSDNNAANELTRLLGYSDTDEGIAEVNKYIKSLGFTKTEMGRLMLDHSSGKENYVSAEELGKYLEMLYNSEVKGSEQIISYMKEQTRVTKIPSVLPTDIEVANKTGELEDTENDSAIIYGPDSDIVLVVCFSNLSDTLSGQTAIRMVADDVYKFWNRY